MQRVEETRVISVYGAILCFQILWHWLLSLHYAAAVALLGIYEYRGHQNVSGFVDLVLPAALAGIAIGRIGWRWSRRKLALFTFLAGVGLVAVTPAYMVLLRDHPLWWWPNTDSEAARLFLVQLLKSWVLVAFFTYAGHTFGVKSSKPATNPDSKENKPGQS
jgi:uncharacterized membrane protein